MTRAAIKHHEEQLRAAMLSSDLEALDRLLDDALVFSGPTGTLVRKEEDLENHRSGRQKLTRLVARELVVELFDDVAVVSALADLAGTFDGAPFDGTYRYMRTWRRYPEGAWRIIGGAVTRSNEQS